MHEIQRYTPLRRQRARRPLASLGGRIGGALAAALCCGLVAACGTSTDQGRGGPTADGSRDHWGMSEEEADAPERFSESDPDPCITSEIKRAIKLPAVTGLDNDGFPLDWSRVAPVAIDGVGTDAQTLKIAADCDNLYVSVQGPNLSDRRQLLLDLDGDAATGEPLGLNDEWAAGGADYFVANDWFGAHQGSPWRWQGAGTAAGRARFAQASSEYKFTLKQLGRRLAPRFGLVFRNTQLVKVADTEREIVLSQIPTRGMWRAPPVNAQGGMIVPAYLEVTDTAGWSALNQAAASMRELPAHDFWAAVSGSNSGPHDVTPSLLARWHALQQSGAALFAYVGTCKHPETSMTDDPTLAHRCDGLRKRSDVVGDAMQYIQIIDAWNSSQTDPKHQPLRLAGVWIDEFYPQFDVDARTESSAHALKLGTSDQVEPQGGYYRALTEELRALSPGFQLIGNAGGRIASDRLNYAKLVDVVCSFEDTLSHLEPWTTDDGKKQPGVALQMLRPRLGQLALVHSNATAVEHAIERVFQAGYSHVYSTDVNYLKPDGNLNKLWNSVPGYLLAQVQQVKSLLGAQRR